MSRLRSSRSLRKTFSSLCLIAAATAESQVQDRTSAPLVCKDKPMKTAYLDAFSGLSGDMLVGALLDAGVDFEKLQHALASLPLKGSRLSSRRKTVSGIAAMKFDVEVMEAQPERHLAQIIAMIEASSIGAAARRRARAIFEVLADAEAKVHHTTPEQVHFHEVGAV